MLKKIFFTLTICTFCLSMISCGKSAEEKAYDRAVDDAERLMKKATKDAERMMKDLGY